MNLSHEQFQSLSRCEAMAMALTVEQAVKEACIEGLHHAHDTINKCLREDGYKISYSCTIEEEE